MILLFSCNFKKNKFKKSVCLNSICFLYSFKIIFNFAFLLEGRIAKTFSSIREASKSIILIKLNEGVKIGELNLSLAGNSYLLNLNSPTISGFGEITCRKCKRPFRRSEAVKEANELGEMDELKIQVRELTKQLTSIKEAFLPIAAEQIRRGTLG